MDVTHTYTKKREQFGIPCEFSDIPAELIHLIERSPHQDDLLLLCTPSVVEIDVTPVMSEHSVGTERITLSSKGMHHNEGGWPKEVDADDLEAKARFRKKARAGAVPECLKQIGPVVTESVKQNRTVDLYEELFQGELEDHSSEPPSARNMTKIKDPNSIKRQVTHISWDPEGRQKFAVSYANMNFQDPRYVYDSIPPSSYVWDLNNPNVPELELTPASPLSFIQYSKTSDSLVAGSYNGLISFFDLRKSGGVPCETSVIENSHHDPVYSVQWIQSKTGTNCSSVSTDGRMLTWDIRRLGEPLDVVELMDESGQSLGGSCMCYLQEAGPTKFLIGTEQGIVVNVNNKKQKGGSVITIYDQNAGKHHSPIYAIERNPIHPKFFLTVGDWTTRIWTEELKTPIMMTQYHSHYLTSGCWSPSRAGVFFVTTVGGTMDVWDFYHTQSEVSYSHKISDASLSSIALQTGQRGSVGRLVAVGDSDGVVHLLEVSDSLAVPRSNEKVAIAGMLDRETKREKNLVARMKDMTRRLQQQQQQQQVQQSAQSSSVSGGAPDSFVLVGSSDHQASLLQTVESDFLKLIHDSEQQIPQEAVAPLEEKYKPPAKSRSGRPAATLQDAGGSSESSDLGVDLNHRLPEAESEVTSYLHRETNGGGVTAVAAAAAAAPSPSPSPSPLVPVKSATASSHSLAVVSDSRAAGTEELQSGDKSAEGEAVPSEEPDADPEAEAMRRERSPPVPVPVPVPVPSAGPSESDEAEESSPVVEASAVTAIAEEKEKDEEGREEETYSAVEGAESVPSEDASPDHPATGPMDSPDAGGAVADDVAIADAVADADPSLRSQLEASSSGFAEDFSDP